MTAMADAAEFLEQECVALRTRLALVHPFVLHESMLPAAAPGPDAILAIERFLLTGRDELRRRVDEYLAWLGGAGTDADPAEQQRRFVGLRWRFNELMGQFDVFQEAITQRSESLIGVWMSGLDVAAADALRLPVPCYAVPPVICYLDRGPGAAIRRARTRLDGGDPSPVAIIRIPRERMVGSGIAASLTHEAGHQVAALLDLLPGLRQDVDDLALSRPPDERRAWALVRRWLGEAHADMHAVALLGIAGTLGLMGVVSLPRVFVTRVTAEDPHPFPWIRVHLSCAIGDALYPHPQWTALSRLWDRLYPPVGLGAERQQLFAVLRRICPVTADLLVAHRPPSLAGRSLRDVLPVQDRSPGRLARLYEAAPTSAVPLHRIRPTLAFAVLGQARADGRLRPEDESRVIDDLLTRWALDSTLAATARAVAAGPGTPPEERPDRIPAAHAVPTTSLSA